MTVSAAIFVVVVPSSLYHYLVLVMSRMRLEEYGDKASSHASGASPFLLFACTELKTNMTAP